MDPLTFAYLAICVASVIAVIFIVSALAALIIFAGPPDTFDIELETERLEQRAKQVHPNRKKGAN